MTCSMDDRPIGAGGLRWRELQAWWMQTRARRRGERQAVALSTADPQPAGDPRRRSATSTSPTTRSTARRCPTCPRFCPKSGSTKTVRARGARSLLGLRMDFLLLVGGRRIVIEVNGSHHYSAGGRPDPGKYGANMRADQELKLRGYEVFRFGRGRAAGPRCGTGTARGLLRGALPEVQPDQRGRARPRGRRSPFETGSARARVAPSNGQLADRTWVWCAEELR